MTASANSNEQVNVYYFCKNGSMVTVMFIFPESNVVVEDDSNKSLFLAKASVSNLIHDEDGDYYEYKAVVNNELQTVKVDANVRVTDSTGTVDVKTSDEAKQLNGLFKSYSVNKYGIITSLREYTATYNGTSDAQAILSNLEGIDKVSKEYTVILEPKGANLTITCDEDATYYYVDKNGNITESSYNGVAVDDNDKVFAVVKDYMVQTLVICEVVDPADVYAVRVNNYTEAMGTVYVDGKKAHNEDVDYERNEQSVITVTPKTGYQIKSVTVNGTAITLDANGKYTIDKVNLLMNVVVTFEAIPAATMDVFVSYVDVANGNTVKGTQLVQGVTAETGKSYALLSSAANKALLTGIPADYAFASANTPVEFQANGYTTATVLVKQVKFSVSADTTYTTGGKADVEVISPAGTIGDNTEVVIKFTPKDTGWSASNEGNFKASIDNGSIGTVSAEYHDADADYFEVTVQVLTITDDATITISWGA